MHTQQMLNETQLLEDAESLVTDLVDELTIRDLPLKDEKQVLTDAAKILKLASAIINKMVADKKDPTLH